jgi:hypothetical protein
VSRRQALAGGLALMCALAFGQLAAFAQITTVPVSIEPGCGPADAPSSVTAIVTGVAPGSTVDWRYPVPNAFSVTGSAVADSNGRATFSFTSSGGRQPGTSVLQVDGIDPDRGPARGFAGFVVPCDRITSSSSTSSTSTSTSTTLTTMVPVPPGTLTLVCLPPLGPPGFVTTAVGAGFPPNVPVTLAWRPGIGGTTAVSDAAGAFRVPVLILHHDVLGPRELVATVAAAAGSTFARGPDSVAAPFLVVPATLGPPRALDPRLVFRQ